MKFPQYGQLPEATARTRTMAREQAALVNAYMEAGFSREEAIEILKTMITQSFKPKEK